MPQLPESKSGAGVSASHGNLSIEPPCRAIPRGCRRDSSGAGHSSHRVWTTRPFVMWPATVQSVRRPLRHFVAYGSTNKYRPVNSCKTSGNTAKRPTLEVYLPCTTATMLTMTATVKAMDSQRCVCRTHLFQFNGTSSEDEPEADRAHLQVLRNRRWRRPRPRRPRGPCRRGRLLPARSCSTRRNGPIRVILLRFTSIHAS
jgi:hypothetical protein